MYGMTTGYILTEQGQFTVRAAALPADKVLQHATSNAGASLLDWHLEVDTSRCILFDSDDLCAAKLLRNPKLGTISVGSYADILILDSNPLADVRILDCPEDHLFAVIKGGIVYSSRIKGLSAQVSH